ncbi:TetR/AcrR family transcriptional regulator [Catenuloplanes japonicus]|uniref:TetR/AcrR family transcriptional regulator n=1 Tax=Catenuloplanes japonicus TaxID=33876 RepID=UPI000526676C|nr:TetR/AcrR family transcriptional regulator [Catenuloplanes japonicus]
MPKKVDHQERRALIIDALMRVAASGGLEAVSLRHVATEAGVTAGMVQHYFATKDEMMRFALEGIVERTSARIDAAMAAAPSPMTPAATVRTLLTTLLPLDEPRRADGRVAVSFLAYAAVEPAAAGLLREGTQQMIAFMADQVRAVRADIDAEAAGAGLIGLMEGLSLYVLNGHLAGDAAIRALDTHLRLVFSSEA